MIAAHSTTAHHPLIAEVVLERGNFRLDADLHVSPGEILGVIGPNGAGKSSLIGAITGDFPLTSGSVTAGGRLLANAQQDGTRVHLQRHARHLGHLDQRSRLFPHLSARENVAFGPRAGGMSRRAAREMADEWLRSVGLPGRGDARANELSGGEQQRVAIARTLAITPTAILLDEPFSALDVATAGEIRILVRDVLRRLEVPTVLVTHDPVDLMTVADRVLVLDTGRVLQTGTVAEVLGSPAVSFAASFAGRVLIAGTCLGHGSIGIENAPVQMLHGIGQLPAVGQPAVATYDPSAVWVRQADKADQVTPAPTATHSWVDTVAEMAMTSTGVRITGAQWPGFAAEVPLSLALERGVRPGARLRFELPSNAVRFATAPSPALKKE